MSIENYIFNQLINLKHNVKKWSNFDWKGKYKRSKKSYLDHNPSHCQKLDLFFYILALCRINKKNLKIFLIYEFKALHGKILGFERLKIIFVM